MGSGSAEEPSNVEAEDFSAIRDRRRQRISSPPSQPDPYLDLLPHAALVMSRRARLSRANTKALRVLARGDALVLSSGRVAFVCAPDAARVKRYLESVSRESDQELTLRVDRSRSERPYVIQLCPHADRRAGSAISQFLLSIFEPVPKLDLCPQTLRSAYGLTEAEARVICEFAGEGRLVTVAARLRLTPNTIRAHAKRVFRKVGVNSQAQLMQLLASGPRRR